MSTSYTDQIAHLQKTIFNFDLMHLLLIMKTDHTSYISENNMIMVKIPSLLWHQLLGVPHHINVDFSTNKVSFKYVIQQHFLAHSTSMR